MDYDELNVNAVCLGILCNFPQFCGEERAKEAAELVRALYAERETLRTDLARVTAERDAAMQDLEEIMFKGGHNIDTCHFCTNGQCYGRGGTQCCEPKWRGIKKED